MKVDFDLLGLTQTMKVDFDLSGLTQTMKVDFDISCRRISLVSELFG